MVFAHPGGAAEMNAADTVSCQDQFMLDRRDDPQNALKNLHRCSAVQEIGSNMENFSFWYVTLPPGSQAGEPGLFERSWKNNLAVLTSPGVGLMREKAIAVLDASIGRGLARGKRENLIEAWRASHDPKIFAEPVAAKLQQPAAPPPATVAATAAKAVPPPAPQATRQTRPLIRRYAHASRSYRSGSTSAAAEGPDSLQSGSDGAMAVLYPAYIPAYAPAYAPPPSYPAAAPPPQAVAVPAAQPAYLPAVPQLIEAPLRAVGTALGQIDQGVQSVTHALIGRP